MLSAGAGVSGKTIIDDEGEGQSTAEQSGRRGEGGGAIGRGVRICLIYAYCVRVPFAFVLEGGAKRGFATGEGRSTSKAEGGTVGWRKAGASGLLVGFFSHPFVAVWIWCV